MSSIIFQACLPKRLLRNINKITIEYTIYKIYSTGTGHAKRELIIKFLLLKNVPP
jgi:hypothetical protein